MDTMDKQEIIRVLRGWFGHYQELRTTMDSVQILFGGGESKVESVVWQLFEAYTKEIMEKVGDQSNWLYWYIYDNDCGKRKLEVAVSTWSKPKKIKSLNDLAMIITE